VATSQYDEMDEYQIDQTAVLWTSIDPQLSIVKFEYEGLRSDVFSFTCRK